MKDYVRYDDMSIKVHCLAHNEIKLQYIIINVIKAV